MKTNNSDYENAEKFLLAAETPEEWISRSLDVAGVVSRGKKAKLATIWMGRTGYTTKDIMYARHRHEYWKGKKLHGWKERNSLRWAKFNFKQKANTRKRWSKEKIEHFLLVNHKYKDKELAQLFSTSIPSIQYWRRKYNIIKKMQQQRVRAIFTKSDIEELMTMSELKLKILYLRQQNKNGVTTNIK